MKITQRYAALNPSTAGSFPRPSSSITETFISLLRADYSLSEKEIKGRK